MKGTLILNDASLPFENVDKCEERLFDVFSTLHSAHKNGLNFNRADSLEGSWNSLIFAEGFELGKWIHSITDVDCSRLVKSVISSVRCPLVEKLNVGGDVSTDDMIFFLVEDTQTEVKALGVAWAMQACSLSFPSHERWNESLIPIVRMWQEGVVDQNEQIVVSNISSTASLESYLNVLAESRQQQKDYLKNIEVSGNPDYPNLLFCVSALSDFRVWSRDANCSGKIIESLNKLNSAIQTAANLNDLRSLSGLTISGESGLTMGCVKHARRRNFKHPLLGFVCFEIHVKNFPDSRRMHILPDYENKTVCIGYFGNHLSTASDPT